MSKTIAPLWFLSNYFYAISLQYTSIASSTVLASMGSIFTFLFATCSKYGDEKVTKYKLLGVMLCFCGGVATAWTDVNGSSESTTAIDIEDGRGRIRRILLPHIITNIEQSESVQSLLGDIAGLLSAIGYGAYTVLIRNVCPKDESRMSMQLFFGYIGLLNMIVLCPFALWIIVSSGSNDSLEEEEVDSIDQTEDQSTTEDQTTTTTTTTTLTGTIFLFLILKGLLDNVLSDYLWARAVILTSATVASVGVGLTIPMAFIADYIMGNYNNDNGSSGGSIEVGDVLGALFVLIGFIFVNLNHELGDRSSRGGSEDNEEGYDFGDSDDALDIVSVDRNEAAILS